MHEHLVCANFVQTTQNGEITAVGYRVISHRAIEVRKWATEILHEYIIKGFAMDDRYREAIEIRAGAMNTSTAAGLIFIQHFKRPTVRQITNILIGLTLFLFTACGQEQINTPENAMTKFEEFKGKEKFIQDDQLFYPGIGDPKLKPILTEKINLSAKDFKELADKGTSTDIEYQNAIKDGLDRFSEIYLELDTEDRERVCSYYEELMDIVGLESSGGHLNNFMYGFDPTKK